MGRGSEDGVVGERVGGVRLGVGWGMMGTSNMPQTRKKYLSDVRSIVVKLGTQLLSDSQKRLDAAFLAEVAQQVVTLRQRGIRVTLVSSGAVGSGMKLLDMAKRPSDLAALQAVAAIGQPSLMHAWGHAFEKHQLPVAQLLLTREDIDDRRRFLNIRNTINAVHELGAVPIINENDTISTDEMSRISFGDNDILAGMVAHAAQADLLVLLTVVDGLLDAEGQSVRVVPSVAEAKKLVRKEKSSAGKGGMDSKLLAAQMVTSAGDGMVVANGRDRDVLPRLLDGEVIGTLFLPTDHRLSSRTRWISSLRPKGRVDVDAGAVKALLEMGKSLLPAGVTDVHGEFERGDCIAIHSPAGHEIARGLSNYDVAMMERIRGKKTVEVRTMLKEAAYDEVVHRDNMALAEA
jgi:glutamate 5-kinase